MPNIAAVLKSEIARVARKEIRVETLSLKKAATAHRSEIAAMKRRTQALERQVASLTRRLARAVPSGKAEASGKSPRFSAKGLTSQRRRLGLSAAACGLLIGASTQSIYNWEAGKAHPRSRHLAAIAALKRMGKKEAMARLEALA
jgi:DNA-binding transcriptional regulator YiaG